MNLEQYKAEIFRRSERKIKKRTITRRALALCIPLVLVVTAVALNPPRLDAKKEIAQETVAPADGYSTGSIFCSYVKAELYVKEEPVTITDKLTVDKLFSIAAFDTGDKLNRTENEPESSYGVVADEQPTLGFAQTSNNYTICFTTADGITRTYYLTQEQYTEILEVLK